MHNGGDKAGVWVGEQISLFRDVPSGRVREQPAAQGAGRVLPGGHK